jgi:hypothetical protein
MTTEEEEEEEGTFCQSTVVASTKEDAIAAR